MVEIIKNIFFPIKVLSKHLGNFYKIKYTKDETISALFSYMNPSNSAKWNGHKEILSFFRI
jgi:hypothetical protein